MGQRLDRIATGKWRGYPNEGAHALRRPAVGRTPEITHMKVKRRA